MNGKKVAIGVGALVGVGALIAAPLAVLLVVVVVLTGTQSQASTTCASADLDAAPVATGPVRTPITGGYMVTSEFGMRLHPNLGYVRLHAGLDMAQTGGPGPVVAAKAGKVAQTARNAGGAGNFIAIDHGGGLRTRYLHLSSIGVTQGQQVFAGQQIGVEGATGIGTGAHLHFETIVNGTAANPRQWLTSNGVNVPGLKKPANAPPPAGSAPAASTPQAVPAALKTASTGLKTQAIGRWSSAQVAMAAVIVSVAEGRGLPERVQATGVATAMAESSLENKAHGDAVRSDTIGLFQIGSEHGSQAQRMDPAWSAGNFFDRLVKVPNYARLSPAEAAHQAQRNDSASRYEATWADAVQVVAALNDNPDLLDSLPTSGAATGCATQADVSTLPAGPIGTCPATNSPAEKGLQPVALKLLRCGHQSFPKVRTMYGVGDRSGVSDHPAGAAVDFMIDDYRSPAGNAYGWKLAKWAQEHAQELGVTYVIFDSKIWNVKRASEGWRAYERYSSVSSDTLLHRDHVHVSVTRS